ncbi:MAG: signal recognition particle protein [Verrucomicrobiales bacterium]|jgi:signal recognition particle subunit SRP54|nr:signal recognition particle protein [Verrucomicrobiales bacterium]
MLSQLAEKFQGVFSKLRGYGKLTESNVADALREVRMALLAADVNYKVTKDFCERVKAQAVGEQVSNAIRPGDMFVKIVHDELLAIFQAGDGALSAKRPLRVALCGLNGAGKTTTAGKLALMLKKQREKVLLVAADLSRPAAVQQLQTLGRQNEIEVFAPSAADAAKAKPSTPAAGVLQEHLAKALNYAADGKFDVTIFDLAGRTEINAALLAELKSATALLAADESLLVADAALGQSAVEVAKAFHGAVPLTGMVLAKFDGDAKGGAAFSLQSVTGVPIKFIGTGERVDQFEVFHADRLIQRLLGMGDLYGLAEKVAGQIDLEDAEQMERKLRTAEFNLQDFLGQMRQLKKLGPVKNLLGMLPGMGNMQNFSLDDKALKRTEAIICSMTFQERRRPDLLNARRRQRIATGSGTSVTEVNDLLHRFRNMKKMMGKLFKGGNQENKLKRMLGGLGSPG